MAGQDIERATLGLKVRPATACRISAEFVENQCCRAVLASELLYARARVYIPPLLSPADWPSALTSWCLLAGGARGPEIGAAGAGEASNRSIWRAPFIARLVPKTPESVPKTAPPVPKIARSGRIWGTGGTRFFALASGSRAAAAR
jgi:hypothetical protein